ncbi:expressed unknown protein [Seminavis robusta]|uniref:Uncharacterized protein n=1 Tax=Seminavis robusta TaxID=568900 RepID=A0A9N8E5T2_9STRA|nr:expressed unknown protein [Seminavis robusta]|eukprot:Sro651_g181510.1 n/a (293) ;mRNA; f:14219-15097
MMFERPSLVRKRLAMPSSYAVPKGVAMEQLVEYGGHYELQKSCPKEMMALLSRTKAQETYSRFMDCIFKDKSTRVGLFGRWDLDRFAAVMEQFEAEFALHGIKVVLCELQISKSSYLWLEYIDLGVNDHYVPPYNVANQSSTQEIKTHSSQLKFPNGVAIEQFGYGHKQLEEQASPDLAALLKERGLMTEYNKMVDQCNEFAFRRGYGDVRKLRVIVLQYQAAFAAEGIDIFICQKKETVVCKTCIFRWLEFVDRSQQPDYRPLDCYYQPPIAGLRFGGKVSKNKNSPARRP